MIYPASIYINHVLQLQALLQSATLLPNIYNIAYQIVYIVYFQIASSCVILGLNADSSPKICTGVLYQVTFLSLYSLRLHDTKLDNKPFCD